MQARIAILAAALAALAGSAIAQNADEFKQLGNTLTQVGAEKAGNKDGTIPAGDLQLKRILLLGILGQDRNRHHLSLKGIQGIELASSLGDIPGNRLERRIWSEFNGDNG